MKINYKEIGKGAYKMMPKETICLVDWCGNWNHAGYCADYNPNTGITVFGLEWHNVPDLKTEEEPTPEEVTEYADYFMEHGSVPIVPEPDTSTPLLNWMEKNNV